MQIFDKRKYFLFKLKRSAEDKPKFKDRPRRDSYRDRKRRDRKRSERSEAERSEKNMDIKESEEKQVKINC